MRTLGVGLIYLAFAAIGFVVGLLLSGMFIDYEVHFDGIPASQLSAQQVQEIVLRDPRSMREYSSFVFGGSKIFTTEGGWLMHIFVFLPVLLSIFAAKGAISAWKRLRSSGQARKL